MFRQRPLLLDFSVLFLTSSVLVLLFLDRPPFEVWDESVYCKATVDMLQQGQWLYPVDQNGQFLTALYGKPPLVNWLQMTSTYALGWSVFALRLPTALFAIGFILMIWASGVLLGGRLVGALAAALALGSPKLIDLARHVWLETPVAALFAASLLVYALGASAAVRKRRWSLLVSGALCGIGLLFKQAFAGFAPAAIVITELIVERRRGWRAVSWVIVATAAVSLWWFVWTVVAVGQPAVEGLYDIAIRQRFLSAMDGHGRHPDDYAIFVDTYLGFGTWVVGLAGWVVLWARATTAPATKRLYLSWTTLVVLHYIVVGLALKTVTPWYQFPVVLPFFIGAAFLAVELWSRNEPRGLRWLVPALLVAGVAESLLIDEVKVVALVVAFALLLHMTLLARLRPLGRPWQLFLAAGLTIVVSTKPWAQTDPRQLLAGRVAAQETTVAVGQRAKWQVWHCLLPNARTIPWPGSCDAVATEARAATQLILEAPTGVSCPLPEFRVVQRTREALLYERRPQPPAGDGAAAPAGTR